MGLSPSSLLQAVRLDVESNLISGVSSVSSLPPDATYKQFASQALLDSLLKKWEPENTARQDANSWSTFLLSNEKCKNWSLQLEWESDRELWGNFLKELDLFFHPSGHLLVDSIFDLLEKGRTGPGAAIGAKGNSLYAKLFSSQLTTTSVSLYKSYSDYIRWYPTFLEAEVHRYSKFGALRIVDSSKCCFVPKNDRTSRMICVEPSLNMYFQLGLGALLERRLADLWNIDLSVQPDKNRLLARQGSVNGQYSTIDLSAASDSISLSLCRLALPEWLFELLCELRSPHLDYRGVKVRLEMMSTMGNGFTFPLQTIIFSAIIRACYHSAGIPLNDYGHKLNWACFGDDLIVDVRVHQRVVRLLGLLGFSCNPDKTFHDGPFRESCGADWFHGQPVRGVYLRRLRSLQDVFVAINLLNKWSAYTGIHLPRCIKALFSSVRHKHSITYVPFEDNADAGIRVPFSLLPKASFRRDGNLSILYRSYVAKPVKLWIEEGKIRFPRNVEELIFNPPGLYISFLYGELDGDAIPIRHDRNLYHPKQRCTPRWDYINTNTPVNGTDVSWQQWQTAVLINLRNPLAKAR